MTPLTIGVLAALGGLAGGYIVRQVLLTRSQEDQEGKYKELILEAKEEALKLKEEAKILWQEAKELNLIFNKIYQKVIIRCQK